MKNIIMIIGITAWIFFFIAKIMKNNIEIHPNRNPFIEQANQNIIICGERKENWEDDYISEEYLIDMENGYYAWKYIKKNKIKL